MNNQENVKRKWFNKLACMFGEGVQVKQLGEGKLIQKDKTKADGFSL